MRKAFERIPKLKLGKYQVGCLRPISSLVSSVCALDRCNYIVAFCDGSPNGIILPNENKVLDLLSLQRTALNLTLRA